MIAQCGDIFPDAEVYVDVVEIATLDGAEAAKREIHDVLCVELLVENKHGAHVAEEWLHEELVAREGAAASVNLGFF